MIVVRSPLRISFAGGGSDLPAFCDHEDGVVVSATIHHSVYIMVAPRLDGKIRVSYSKTELVDSTSEIEHDIVRNAIEVIAPEVIRSNEGIEIVSMADLSSGAGLGSSGAFTVGLVQSLCAYDGQSETPYELFEDANYIEINKCGHPCGYQDQAASSFGGLRMYRFHGDEVTSEDLLFSRGAKDLESRMLLVDLGLRGSSSQILKRQSDNMDDSRTRATVRSMANMAETFRNYLLDGNVDMCCEIVGDSWSLKSSLDPDISNDMINDVYTFAREHGALGGKVCGAGGRGMLLVLSNKDGAGRIAGDLYMRWPGIKITTPTFYPQGSTVVWSSS